MSKGMNLRSVQWGEVQVPSEHDTIPTQATEQAASQSESSLQTSIHSTEREVSSVNQE